MHGRENTLTSSPIFSYSMNYSDTIICFLTCYANKKIIEILEFQILFNLNKTAILYTKLSLTQQSLMYTRYY